MMHNDDDENPENSKNSSGYGKMLNKKSGIKKKYSPF